ncbi:GNAT family N-acetyltransferase [Allosphingosinicella sp.]|uniref:GNAT family N-acetyltransferase n=1 Tax=Allosphingosinicella sp. TaxID=2823234 RepID=UPI002FC1F0FA
MHEGPVRRDGAATAIDVEAVAGFAASIDAAAEAAEPRHRFLRTAWFAAPGQAGDAVTLTAKRPDGGVVAALPTARLGPAPLRLREIPGCYWPYRSFPVAADATDDEIVGLLSHPETRRVLGRAWRMGPAYADDPTGARLARLAERGGWTRIERRIATSFLLDIPEVRREAAWPRNSTLRKNRWFEKELAKSGALDWRFVTGDGWTGLVFDELAAIEAKSWIPKRTGGHDAKFLAPHHRRIWEAVARDPVLTSMLHAAILTIGGSPAAFAFDLDVGALKYAIANSYDQRFARNSPGRVLAYRSLAGAMDRGIERVDWGAGDSGYKSTLGAVPGPEIVDCLFVRSALLGRLLRPFWKWSGR